MAYEDLSAFFDEDRLELPYKEKLYKIPSPNASDGLKLQAIVSVAVAARGEGGPNKRDVELLNDAEELDAYRMALGDVYDELLKDEVPWAAFKHIALTALTHWAVGSEESESFWNNRGKAPNRAQKRASKRSKNTAKAKKTRTRASTSGTTSQ